MQFYNEENSKMTIIHLYSSVRQITSRHKTLVLQKVIFKMVYSSSVNMDGNMLFAHEMYNLTKIQIDVPKLNILKIDINLIFSQKFDYGFELTQVSAKRDINHVRQDCQKIFYGLHMFLDLQGKQCLLWLFSSEM